MPTSPTAATPTSIRKACASRRSGSTRRACCRRTCSISILLNCQVPRERLSDLRAQMAANRLGVMRMPGACARSMGATVVLAAGEALLDYAERKMRAGIAAIPDGTYRFDRPVRQSDARPRPAVRRRDQGQRRGDAAAFREPAAGPRRLQHGLHGAARHRLLHAVKTVVDPTILPNAGLARPHHGDGAEGHDPQLRASRRGRTADRGPASASSTWFTAPWRRPYPTRVIAPAPAP